MRADAESAPSSLVKKEPSALLSYFKPALIELGRICTMLPFEVYYTYTVEDTPREARHNKRLHKWILALVINEQRSEYYG